jgi:hypothetical protein
MNVRKIESTMGIWVKKVAVAKAEFERRWSVLSLDSVDPSLAQRLREQQSLFDAACVTGSFGEIEDHGAAMVRGWAVCAEALAEDRSGHSRGFLFGGDRGGSRTKVVIRHERPPSDHWMRVMFDDNTIWLTPDEVAHLINLPELKLYRTLKRQFPTADIQAEANKPDAG